MCAMFAGVTVLCVPFSVVTVLCMDEFREIDDAADAEDTDEVPTRP